MFPWLRLVALGSFLVFTSRTEAAESVAPGDWIPVPQDYVLARSWVRGLQSIPVGQYRVIVDVPPQVKGGARVAQSSGHPKLDVLAREFAEAHARKTAKLRELNQSRELRLPLLFTISERKGVAEAGTGKWRTPIPFYPDWAKRDRQQGAAVIRITTDPDGRVAKAQMVVTTGSDRLDAFVTGFVRREWMGPPNASRLTTIHFQIR